MEEFDTVARDYTRTNLEDPVRRYLKQRSTENLLRLFSGRDPLLEIGCGTGLETLPILRNGHLVTGVDISPGMLAEAVRRFTAAGVESRFSAVQGGLRDLETVLSGYHKGAFSGAYSTYGAFGLEHDISGVPAILHRLLSPGGRVFLAVLNTYGLPPHLYSLLYGKPGDSIARLRNPIQVKGVTQPIEISTWTPRSLEAAFRPHFDLVRVESASVLAPPYYSERLFRAFSPEARAFFSRVDRKLSSTWPGALFGEWMFATFQRVDDAQGRDLQR